MDFYPPTVLTRLIDATLAHCGRDLSTRSSPWLTRAVLRRMGVTRTACAQDYAGLIERSPEEASQFALEAQACDLRLFAEPAWFEELRSRVWPALIARGRKTRVWIPECANGAHAVSIALSALECGAARADLVVHATASSESEIVSARRCAFDESFLRDLPLGFLRRWFEQGEGRWHVNLDVQQGIRFSLHRLGEDPMLADMDLIALRHGLDFYAPGLRETLCNSLPAALRPGGFLWIGKAPPATAVPGCSRQGASSGFFRKDSGEPEIATRVPHDCELPLPPLRDSDRFAPMFAALPIAAVVLDRNFAVQFCTAAAQELFSLRAADIGRKLTDFRPKFAPDLLSGSLKKAAQTGVPVDFDATGAEGLRCRVEVWAVGTDGFLVVARSAAAAAGFPELLAALPLPAAVLGVRCSVRDANQGFLAAFGCAPGQAVPQLQPALSAPPSRPGELRTFDVSAGPRCFHVRCSGNAPGWVVTAEDVTAEREERARFQAALEQSNTELRSLTASVFSAQEDERRRVAAELHDNLAQRLAVLEMSAERLQQRARSLSRAAAEALSEVRAHAAEISTELRRIAHGLHPPAIDDLGLQFALRSLAADFSNCNSIPVDFRVVGDLPPVPPDIAIALYRIAQEALRNVAKHAQAAHASLSLAAAPEGIELSIEDDGRGFPARSAPTGGIGLLSMEERARLIGASLSLESEPGKGAAVRIAVPLESIPFEYRR